MIRKKSKMTKPLIAATFLITIFALVTTVSACGSNRILFMAKGDDLDLNATDLIIGEIKYSEGGEPPSVKALFHQKIYDDAGKKVYAMMGMLTDGLLLMTDFCFYCPVFQVFFINVWFVMGEGVFKTTDTNYNLLFRRTFPITMPNTEGKYVPASMLMFLSTTAEYCEIDPALIPPGEENPVLILPEGGWALAAALWDVGIPMDVGFGYGILPIGPVAYFTRTMGL
ncbi:MAG: hypothetical protein ACFFDF_17905 [Candidatus Odinarchaeota archaeon]